MAHIVYQYVGIPTREWGLGDAAARDTFFVDVDWIAGVLVV